MKNAQKDSRPGLAIIANIAAPYRVHLHKLIAKGIPEFKLHSVFTKQFTDFRWDIEFPPEINAISFANPNERSQGHPLSHPIKNFIKAGKIIRHLKEHDVRAVISMGYNDLCLLRIIHYCHRNHIPIFIRGDANILLDKPRTVMHTILKRIWLHWVFQRSSGAMPVGSMGHLYFEKYGVPEKNRFLVPFSPDYDTYQNIQPDAVQSFQKKHQLDTSRRRIIFCGRLISLKRIDLLIDAFLLICATRPDWDLLFVGDGELKEALQCRIPHNLKHRFKWIGFQPVEQVAAAMHSCHLMVLPSKFDQWGLVVNEAMAAGLPVITSNVVGAGADLIIDGQNGKIFETGSMESLKAALLDATDTNNYERYRQATSTVLENWRHHADPVKGVRQALASTGLI